MTVQTLNQLHELRLSGMATALETQLQQPGTYAELPFLERLGLLVTQEHLQRENRKQTRLVRQAGFRLQATLQEIDYQQHRNLKRAQIAQLSQGEWLELTQAKADGSYQKLLTQLAKTQLLILDDWGLEVLKPGQRNDLMEIMDDRSGVTSTVLISQLPTEQWYAAIGDNTLADAILDRLMHNSHRLELKGESMRKHTGENIEREHLGDNS